MGEMVVADLYAEDNRAACGGDEISDHERPVVEQESLHHEKDAPEKHRKKRGHSYAVRVACAYGIYSLRQITEHHKEGSGIAEHAYPYLIVHNIVFR